MRGRVLALAFLLMSLSAGATTYVVRPDGTGDYPTIQAAIDATVNGDVVELTDGVFSGDGNRDLDFLGKSIVVRSASGVPANCVIHCGGSPGTQHRGFLFHLAEPASAEVAGITITGGYVDFEPWGGGVLCELGATPTFRSCVFQGNRDSALGCITEGGATLIDCVFRQNFSYVHGGAIYAYFGSGLSVTRCEFTDNHTEMQGGALHNYATPITLSECVFRDNTAIGTGALELMVSRECIVTDCLFEGNLAKNYGAMLVFFSDATIERCTFARNTATFLAGAFGTGKSANATLRNCTFWNNPSPWGSLNLSDGGTVMENCILVGNPIGPSMYVDGDAALSCCDIWGNSGGDWVPGIAWLYGQNGNIREDPLLCDPENGDFTLREDSPCAPFTPPNPKCDLIGAWPVGCAPSSVPEPPEDEPPAIPASWGAVKALYR